MILKTNSPQSVAFSRSAAVVTLALAVAACGSSGDGDAGSDTVDADAPTIVVTTNILGDVVGEVVGDQAQVITIMPVGADPHDFQASAQEIDQLLSADALIVNGGDFEEGLIDVIESAENDGVSTYEAMTAVETLEFASDSHDDHDDHDDEEHDDEEHSDEEDHEDEEHSDEGDHDDEEHSDEEEHVDEEHSDEGDHDDEEDHDDHDHDGDDPHFFTDPTRMADAVDGIVSFLSSEVDGLDTEALEASAADYIGELEAVDAEVIAMVEGLADDQRVLVTSHEVFGYFADRYDFEVVGVVLPGASTNASASAGEIAELAEVLTDEGVTAIFSDSSGTGDLVETLAAEVGDVSVVELYTESLGDADSDGATYIDMVRANAERITTALAR